MRVSPIARVVRISVVTVATMVLPVLAACSNDPLAPTVQASRASANVARKDSATAATGGSVPWFDASSGGSVPWF